MKRILFTSMRARLTFWFLFLALAPLLMGIGITFIQQKKMIKQESFNKLISIRDLKVQQLNEWVDGRMGDLKITGGDFEIRGLEHLFEKEQRSVDDINTIAIVRELLNRRLRHSDNYEELFIVGAKTGIVEISSNKNSEGINKSHDPYFTNPLNSGEVYIKDIYHSKSMNRPQMTISLPIYCMSHNTHIIGILVARINLESSLYNLLSNRVGLGETGETLIVNKDVVALNELRWYENAPLNLKIIAEPAVNAANGLTGIIATTDYRDKEILAAYTHIPEMGWGFVCKQDMDELNAPIRALGINFFILLIVSSVVVIFIVILVIKRITKPILNMNTVTQKIKNGDYTARASINSRDELAMLASSINEMAASIESHITTRNAVANISDTMIGKSNLQEFGISLLKRLMKVTEADMSTFYILNEGTEEYEHFASVGANEEMLTSFNAKNPQGEIGNALSTKNIYHLKNIPEDTIFKFKTMAGEAIPKEIFTIPIMVENNVVALISLVKIEKFSVECHAILKQSWINLNTSYSNLLASERTRIFAEQLSNTNQQLEAQSEELQEQAEELQNQTDELYRTSDELQEQNIELEAQRKQVEAANKMKSEFLSNMSHELRTPLNSIMALSRVLIMQANGKLNEEENNYLEIVERNGKRLLSLINDILDLSKIESGKMEVEPKLFSIPNFLQIIKENMQSLAEQKGLAFTLELPDDIPQIETDESRLHQVLTNIVGNAVKFTDKGSVAIGVRYNQEQVLIAVKDSGIGIADNELPYIFDEFRQVDGTSSRQYEGTGLGLAIAKKMMNILGGSIEVESVLAKGTTFTIAIPIKWHEEFLLADSFTVENSLSSILGNTILVVDDDPKTVRIISEYLNEEGYKTITATSGKEALKLAEKYQPFAITLDIVMEDMDGWEVMQNLKSNVLTRDIPVIVVSVSDDRDTGLALGAVGFINKPVNKHLLISQIKEIDKKPETIMVVDDNEFELSQISKIIENENISTIQATGGKECIQIIKNKTPDILILDLMMPDMDGFTVLEKLRSEPKTQNLPVIIVTAKDLTKIEKDRLSGNISSLLSKGELDSQHLLTEIKRILKQIEKKKQLKSSTHHDSQMRILMVEDNPDAIIQVKSVLERKDYIVDVANGGQEALAYVKHTIPDGIILDLMMPEIDGFEVLEEIRATEKTKNIPILILTAKDLTKKDMAKLSANNIQQLIHKGDVDIEGLLLKVELMLGNQLISKSTPKPELRTPNLKPEKDLPNILIVEDNLDNMITIKAILKGKFTMDEALDGEQALKKAQAQLPDLILLDMSLPKMGGKKIIKTLKASSDTKYIPVIAVTAQAMKGDKEKIIKMGCDAYVSKPIDHEELMEEISKLLSS